MNIERFQETILTCRFCFMCRHLSGTGNVTFTEADTPRVRTAMLYAVLKDPEKLNNPDLIATIYRADLSGSCRRNCVNHYDECSLVLAARRDIVETGLAPEKILRLADELEKSAKWDLSGSGDTAILADDRTIESAAVIPAMEKILKKAALPFRILRSGCIGKSLLTLGFKDRALKLFREFTASLNDSGIQTLVVPNPAAYDALTKDFPEAGIKINAKVMHSSEFLAQLDVPFRKQAGELCFLESDFLRNYDSCHGPDKLLERLGATRKEFGTNDEESYSCGEGALVLQRIEPQLVEKLAVHVETQAGDQASGRIITASPHTRIVLSSCTKLRVKTLEELAADCTED